LQEKIVLFNASIGKSQHVKNPALARETIDLLAGTDPAVSLHVMSGASTEEVVWMLNAADCLLVTSLHEGAPKIVQEAMACNLPVVSVPCGDVPERLTGVYPGGIASYDVAELAGLVREVLDGENRSNGREQAMQQGLSITTYAEKAIQTYLELQGTSQVDHARTESLILER
jgi:glycosyltransferase involved in cell wall biosynthesis